MFCARASGHSFSFTPHIVAHHKDLDWRLVQQARILALEPLGEPAQVHLVEAESHGVGSHAEVVVARHAPAPRTVLPRADDQLLASPGVVGGPVLLHPLEIAESAAEEYVVPAADVHGRDVDVGMLVLNAQFLPVVIEGGMLQPVEVVVSQTSIQVREVLERKVLEGFGHPVHGLEHLLLPGLGDALGARVGLEVSQGELQQGPGHVEAQLEGAPLVGPPFVVVGGSDVWCDGG